MGIDDQLDDALIKLGVGIMSAQCPPDVLARIHDGNVGGWGNYEAGIVVALGAHDVPLAWHILAGFARSVDAYLDESRDEDAETRAVGLRQFMRATLLAGRLHGVVMSPEAALAPVIATLKRCVGIVGLPAYNAMKPVTVA